MIVVSGIVATLLVSMVLHEFAHGVAMRRHGVRLDRAGLGIPLPPMLIIDTKRRFGFDLTVSPWLVMAYVEPSEKDQKTFDALPYRAKAWCYNAGIVANILVGLVAQAGAWMLAGRFQAAAVCLMLAAATWVGRKVLAGYVLPAVAAPALALTVFALILSWSSGSTGMGFSGLGELAPHTAGVGEWLGFLSMISFALALLNMLPLGGLDNGRVVQLWLQRWNVSPRLITAYERVGLAFVGLSLLGAVASDGWAAISALIN